MDKILVEKHASSAKLEVMGVYDWPIWRKEASTFPWKAAAEAGGSASECGGMARRTE